ncbi:MAG: hypothetical protein IM600_05070 [Bacteroidetes bacterium]|nr:hypothetical protein [Bacteroidota bacterium]MCA6442785.1 hypothetical protein [Bacteroidota bacterium]
MKNCILIILIFIFSCKPKLKESKPITGEMNPASVVFIGGNGLGNYADGALNLEAQKNSVSNLLAQQLGLVGGEKLTQPLVGNQFNGFGLSSLNSTVVTAKSFLDNKVDCKGITSLSPIKPNSNATFSDLKASVPSASYTDFSVPFAKSYQMLLTGYGNPGNTYYNPFFERFAKNKSTSSIIDDALSTNPSFFVLQPGLHDVLQYAVNGGASDSLTSESRFNNAIDALVNRLTSNGAKGVIINVPDVTKFPYFNTIPYNGLTLDQTKVNDLTLVYNVISNGSISFSVGANAFVAFDPSAPIGARQLKDGEMVTLGTPLDSVKCNFLGSLNPFENRMVLSLTEIAAIRTTIAAYNDKLKGVCQQKNLALVDAFTFYNSLFNGIIYNGNTINAQFVKGGAFSLDGINLNPIGNALLTNECIKAINKQYKSRIPQLNANQYPGVVFP